MAKEIVERRAADNAYLHKDFHGALSAGLDYVADRYGEEAVRDYLRQFALSFYAPLREKIQQQGLVALRDHIEKTYAIEGRQVAIACSDEEMTVRVESCPAVMHMRAHGYTVSPHFHETTRAVNDALCEGSDFHAELLEYDEQTGRSEQRFKKREFTAKERRERKGRCV